MAAEQKNTPTSDEAFDVVIAGAGPVGLVSAVQCGRAGLRTLLLERRPRFSTHVKAAGIHARTMEFYRKLGLAETIRSRGADQGGAFSVGWMTRLSGIEIGHMIVGNTPEDRARALAWSPETPTLCSQDIYEPLLAETLDAYPSVTLRLSSEVVGVAQDATGVDVTFRDGEAGTRTVRAAYMIGADGSRSPTRQRLAISETGEPSFGTSINVVFDADLEACRAGRDYSLFWIINADTQGAFGWRRRGNLWSYNFEAAEGEPAEAYTPERCAEIIRLAAGVPDLAIKVTSILPWLHDQAVADRWRSDRVFLAGDAAHRFPPHGGFGMNSGIQDSHNLIWKIVARQRWGAGDALLDTYEAERQPVARANSQQCLLNTRRMAETGWLRKGNDALAAIETPEGEPLREAIRSAIPRQREQFSSQGQQFGYVYASPAIVADGSEPEQSTVSDYRPSGHPGARAPHAWVGPADQPSSTLDLCATGFTVLADATGGHWLEAAARVAQEMNIPIAAHALDLVGSAQSARDLQWSTLIGVKPGGAILVRPDGHVGARWTEQPQDAASDLKTALGTILAIDGNTPTAKPEQANASPDADGVSHRDAPEGARLRT